MRARQVVVSEWLSDRKRRVAIHGHIEKSVHMRVSTKVEDCPGTIQAKYLSLGNVAVLAMLVKAQEECIDSIIRDEALVRVGHVVGWIRRKDALDQLARQSLALRRQFCNGNSGKRTVPALEFDLRLDRSLFQNGVPSSPGIKAAEKEQMRQSICAGFPPGTVAGVPAVRTSAGI